MYRSGGENVYPAEVEAVLARLPGVRELAVLGVPDQKWGESGLVAVVPEPGMTITLDAVRAFGDGKLARFKLPTALLVLDALPRSATDKISRPKIREAWLRTR
jgi:fatty-acyl-CoA synthase